MTPRLASVALGALVVAVALLLAVPTLTVLASLLWPSAAPITASAAPPALSAWSHLAATVLPGYVGHSLALCLGVAVATLSLALPPAWLCARYRFPGRRLLAPALLLPLALPAYLSAYAYTAFLDVGGPLQTALRAALHLSYGDYWFPDLRSLPGAIAVLALALYPYVYLLARNAFEDLAPEYLEAAATLGLSPLRAFLRVGLPLCRPAIVAGLALALMETLADFGTVQFFGVPALTTGIYRTWFALGEPLAAAQIAAVTLLFALTLLALEQGARRHARYYARAGGRSHRPHALRGTGAVLAVGICLLPLCFGFLLPAGLLAQGAWHAAARIVDGQFLTLAGHSLGLAAVAAVGIVTLALLLAYGARLVPCLPIRLAVAASGLGYAVPGTVLAIGILLPLTYAERGLNALLREAFGFAPGLFLTGTLVAVLFAYAVRFLAVALGGIEAGLGRIRPAMDEAGRSLGLSGAACLWRIHLPLLRGTLLTACLLTFVDTLKELPATLLLRPFNFSTLAIRAYDLANEERLAEAACPALAIVLVGILPVLLLGRGRGVT
jgi:iron(III) transport system permease protein